MKPRKSSIETKGIIRKYLFQGLKQIEIAKLLSMSRQRIYYWIQKIRKEDI